MAQPADAQNSLARRWFARPILNPQEESRIVNAIHESEQGNRGEVRVHLEKRCSGNALDRARELFQKLGLDQTRDATGVLLYIAVKHRKAAIFAGEGIHGAAQPDFWQLVIDAVARGFAQGDRAGGIVQALGKVGDLLRESVPGDDSAGNELPDEVSTS